MFKPRGYKRETPVELQRDFKLFAVACEGGKREPDYFGVFTHMSPRLSVDIIGSIVSDEEMERKYETKSAPKWVLDRAITYIEREGLSDEDDLWFVLDKDRWSDEQIREIAEYCNGKDNWNIVVSNPCFELWLFLHKLPDFTSTNVESCGDFKFAISGLESGGYHQLKFINSILFAIENAKKLDSDPNHYMPKHMETKVYKLAESMMQFVGINNFNYFLDITLPNLVKQVFPTPKKKRKA